MNCPLCNNGLEKTNFKNSIFKENNYFCKVCNSYHIVENIDISDYYKEEYHQNYKYSNKLVDVFQKLNLSGNRALANFKYFSERVNNKKGESFIEIGGGTGEKYIIFNKYLKPEKYTVIEPDTSFNFNRPNLHHINNLFEEVNPIDLEEKSIVLMFHVLEHIFDLNSFFEKLKSIKPKYFYFEVPNCNNKTVRDDSLLNHPHFHHFSKESLTLLFKKQGLIKISLDEVEPISYHPYQKPSKFKKYINRFVGKHEKITENGIYLRGIYKFSDN